MTSRERDISPGIGLSTCGKIVFVLRGTVKVGWTASGVARHLLSSCIF